MADPPSAGRLEGLTAFVTGSTTGIGESMARRFASEGARVLVHGLDETAAQTVAADIRAKNGEAAAIVGDLADLLGPERLASKAVQLLGYVDMLVNNAALKTRSNLESTDAATFDRVIAVNIRAPLLLTRSLPPHFRARDTTTVLNIGSVNGYCGERTCSLTPSARAAS